MTMEPGISLSKADIVENIFLCFESVNGSCKRSIFPPTIRVLLYLLLGSMSVLTVCGNLLVIIPIIHFKQLHTPTNYLILSLAVSDLLLGVLVMPPSMVHSLESCWYFGDLFCKIYTSTDVMLCTASILNLCFISIDRYYAVCRPLLYRTKITVHVVLIMMLVIWTVSAVVGFCMIFLGINIWGIEDFYYNNVACEGECILFQNKVSSTVSSVISFYIPGVGMLSIYLKIFLIAQRQARSIQGTTNQNSVGKSQRKATKTLAVIMGVFLSFWTPFFVVNCIDPFISYSTPPVLFVTFVWIGYLNSTINPMVYAFFYSWFRKAFRMIISGQIFQPDSSIMQLFSE
ncbi:trace amine-associated receptor 1-like [Oncorhynchus kisutch]|uniref:Trace amine-associated receptor 1 n=1 Tax=Oncorhynchus kisutch TaxID=8019 RepID=A0A8C7MFE8_ONCKI|nr:trace amine-associated receptor 1-like [Oncorhynchus kisutch]